jgi:hypothetical protein
MKLTLIDVPEAVDRLEAGERAYEYQTVNNSVRILGPACGFGPAYLRRLREEKLYAETLDEANAHAMSRDLVVTGVWFVKS